MHGNAWEWVEDCWTPNPQVMPVFAAGSRRVRSAIRSPVRTTKHFYNTGLRVALSLGG